MFRFLTEIWYKIRIFLYAIRHVGERKEFVRECQMGEKKIEK